MTRARIRTAVGASACESVLETDAIVRKRELMTSVVVKLSASR
jgi:hypothetical protein